MFRSFFSRAGKLLSLELSLAILDAEFLPKTTRMIFNELSSGEGKYPLLQFQSSSTDPDLVLRCERCASVAVSEPNARSLE